LKSVLKVEKVHKSVLKTEEVCISMVKAIFSSTYDLPVAKEKFGSQFKALLPFFRVGGKLFLRQHADVKITTYF
jgi:hypothetical protein